MLDDQGLEGRVAVVCGGTGHVGGAIVAALAQMGARVAVHGHTRSERAEAIIRELERPDAHVALDGDLADSSIARRVFQQAAAELGAPVTVVVDSAYPSQPPRRVADLDDDYLERHLNGLRIHVNVCRAALEGMRAVGWGRIILLSGALAWRPFPGFAVYAAVKAGASAFARTLALEEGVAGITVNTVVLGRVEYDDGGQAFTPHPGYEALDEVTQRRVALPRMASPQDIASTIRYLASPAASAVTGQAIFLAAGEPI